MQYRRARVKGGTYFFTLVTYKRQPLFAADSNIQLLREAFQKVMRAHPFSLDAHVILPDHIHCVWTLPGNDWDFSTRWRLIKSHFTRNFVKRSGGQSPWQKKFWEHWIRNDHDLEKHVEYIHYNPVKHGLVDSPIDWPLSSIHRYINDGLYTPDWGDGQVLHWGDGVGRE